jgi:hypothetical protein
MTARRLLATCAVALLALGVLAGATAAATHKPRITSLSPKFVPIGGRLIIKGKYFASGASHNRVVFSRATDGKAVRARPRKATRTRIEVLVPRTIKKYLPHGGAARFRVAIMTKVLGPKTARSRSPMILAAGD